MSDPASGSNEQEKTPEQIMAEQDAIARKKYGGMQPKKKGLLLQQKGEQKYFDSADWAMKKEQAARQGPTPPVIQAVQEVEKLKPKLEPTPIPARRVSHLDSMEKIQ